MQLFLVRHADAKFNAQTDHQRPLSEIGKLQAQLSAQYIKQNIKSPAVNILCSDALRTLTTAQIIAQELESCQLSENNVYYQASVGQWCDGIASQPLQKTVVLVGHNPTISNLSNHLNSTHAPTFSPACVAHYELEILTDGLKLPAQHIDFFKPNVS